MGATASIKNGRKPPRIAAARATGVILAATDFSNESLRALEYAALLREELGGNLHLLHVHDVNYAIAPELAAIAPLISADELKRAYIGRLQRLALKCWPDTRAQCHIAIGRAFDEICKAAEEIDASLIVISTHGHTGLKRICLGSTAERVVRHAPCPVLVARCVADCASTTKLPRQLKMLVPIDFSDCSRAGLRYAIGFARKWKAEITLLYSIEMQALVMPDRFAAYDQTPSLKAIERAAKDQMTEFVRQTDFEGISYRTDIQPGYPAHQICEYAKARKFDLIVTSTHGFTGLKHVLIGSVAEHIVRYAHCPVLVVPRKKQRALA